MQLIVSNVQETDLAGHEQDPVRYARLLEEVDQGVEKLLDLMGPEDALIISADHGNDPTIGHSRHTRELVPLLLYRPGQPIKDLGVRETLADVGATGASLLGLNAPESGRSFA